MSTLERHPADVPSKQFESRKQDHIRLSLEACNEAGGMTGLHNIHLIHEALPEINFDEIQLGQDTLGVRSATPFLVSSMTAGHYDSIDLNRRLAQACESRGWLMGVGSQRRELGDPEAAQEWQEIRKAAPDVRLLGNLGLSQLIQTPTDQVEKLIEALEATAMIIHTNPLQECLQPEGTPQFRGGLQSLEKLVREVSVPVVLKETGCGFHASTFHRLRNIGLSAVDVSGFGGTHWGRIEGQRSQPESQKGRAAESFADWGISTWDSLQQGRLQNLACELWASGGVRSGLDAAKLLAGGARIVGFAKPALQAALQGEQNLNEFMELTEFELKVALFCTGSKSLEELGEDKIWPMK